jgi:hypothetical protein
MMQINLELEEQNRLIGIMVVSIPLANKAELFTFLQRCGLPKSWIKITGLSPIAVVTLLIGKSCRQRRTKKLRSPHTTLGAILERLIEETRVGSREGLYFVNIMQVHQLIECRELKPDTILKQLWGSC